MSTRLDLKLEGRHTVGLMPYPDVICSPLRDVKCIVGHAQDVMSVITGET